MEYRSIHTNLLYSLHIRKVHNERTWQNLHLDLKCKVRYEVEEKEVYLEEVEMGEGD